ncbi:3-deoxy-7-phosphoheptulonate synthase [Pseudomonas salmasensis]|uniref:Phospho-2-dehydro-3-deoxyheptonate aldolase n=2 Tax=Pseudomonas salmasensis TaxID=2745514 RepID=A0ABU5FDL7_9PSED|nr:3-deoxy-7-phosphoheptulonate synthase [Pseudomonas salmasensis]MDY4299736.1 3-deoxy-7-phosphoheptulonate synthase [Pseudomonas salmasensis]
MSSIAWRLEVLNLDSVYASQSWRPESWRDKERRHMPNYPGKQLSAVLKQLSRLPGLVNEDDIVRLRRALVHAADGQAFVQLMGQREQSLNDVTKATFEQRIKTLESLSGYLALMLGLPVLAIGPVAGSYARTQPDATELLNGIMLDRYFGDMVNCKAATPWARRPDANRLLWAYEATDTAMQQLRGKMSAVHTCHECAHLDYEQALVRRTYHSGFYASSASLLWIDACNLFHDSCYVEFARGLQNPVALRLGQQIDTDVLVNTVERLNPDRQTGKILLIANTAGSPQALGEAIRALQTQRSPVIWLCDPLNIHTAQQSAGSQTQNAALEWDQTLNLHRTLDSRLSGIALEVRSLASSHPAPERHEDPAPFFDFQKTLQLCSHLAHAYRESR